MKTYDSILMEVTPTNHNPSKKDIKNKLNNYLAIRFCFEPEYPGLDNYLTQKIRNHPSIMEEIGLNPIN